MPTSHPLSSAPAADLNAAIHVALQRVPPLWPLRHFVAVNPFVGLVDRPFAAAAELLQRVVGAAPLQSADTYREEFRAGRIELADLEAVTDREGSASALIEALAEPSGGRSESPLLTVADFLDRAQPSARWSAFVVDEISKWCGVAFDENQTSWNSPWKHEGLYVAWRAAARHDRNPEVFGVPGFRGFVADLPEDPIATIAHCCEVLHRRGDELPDFLHRQLVTICGWAGFAQYRVREDALRGTSNGMLADLLAIRLAYDAALFRGVVIDTELAASWRQLRPPALDATRCAVLARWQSAYEAGYQRRLAHALAEQPAVIEAGRPDVQAVFCIDVRSEVFRRHLERALPGTQTIGFAGFFGFPVAHCSPTDNTASARCPVLLLPNLETREALAPAATARLHAQRAAAGAWKAFQNSAASCFSFVESVGLGFGLALARPAPGPRLSCSRVAPSVAPATFEQRVALAAAALKNMSLVRNFARLILICGHGSESANNPYASALDCGACGGHAGDVNARLAAATLNDPAVRAQLSHHGLVLPPDTVFIAGLHNTTTDDVVLFDLEGLPESHRDDATRLREALGRAGAAARRERAPKLGLAGVPDARVDAAVRARASDLAELRPEWGLANNAAFVAAPRSRTAGLNLEGRVFLHDYDASADPEDKVLTLILCAPVVVASWINLQYYASRIDPERYGSGNKVLHNVVGGLGVLEGNGGDLKVGLPLQSIHDGTQFVHEPRRLAVYLEAEPERISGVLEQNPTVRQLFAHEWLHLFALQGKICFRYHADRWSKV